MMKQFTYLIALFLFIQCSPKGQGEEVPTLDKTIEIPQLISLEKTTDILKTIASDEMNGRPTNSEGFDQSADYLISILEEANFKPVFESFKEPYSLNSVSSYNVVASTKEYDKEKPTVILSGHLDHLKPTNEGDGIFNGANDNASGVTAAMQIGLYLAKKNYDYNIVVALFSAEEMGLIGSEALAKKMKVEGHTVQYVFNFEMIGTVLTNKPGKTYLTGYNKSTMATEINKAVGFEFANYLPKASSYGLFGRSDNYPFYEQFAIPAQTFSSFDFKNYDYYHHTDDEIEELDLENMNSIINTAAFGIGQLLDKNIVLSIE